MSLLDNYYERNRADDFEAVFGGTHLGRQPTENRHRYVVLRFNFSAFKNALETLEYYFEEYCQMVVRYALERNADLFPEAARQHIRASSSVNGQLNELFVYAGEHGIPLYVLIDEYDNFANTILAYHGEEAYQSFTHGGGFYRNFFATLKEGAGHSDGGLERMFITGVSPITMDDVTSGFNIGKNISLHLEFNDMLGFTEEEVCNLLEMYRDYGVFSQDVEAAMDVMREWYNGYRFAEEAEGDLYNTDMVLYFLDESMPNKKAPRELIDTNVRIDYGKLRHLLTVNRQLNGNFDLLRHIIGEQTAESNIQLSFPLDRLDRRENFLSLLHYFGLLSIRDVAHGVPRLGIPNQTVKRLMYGYLRDAYDDVGVFSVDVYTFSRLMRQMAYEGAWQPVLDFLRDALAEQTGIRDYMDGEKVIHGFVAAHLSMIDQFMLHSEYELNKGYADLYLEPFVAQYSDMKYGYVLELKYLKRSETLDESLVADKVQEAVLQVRSYLADPSLRRRYPSVQHLGLAMVFHGWELVAYEAVGDAGE